jgi:hypothetical protein
MLQVKEEGKDGQGRDLVHLIDCRDGEREEKQDAWRGGVSPSFLPHFFIY